MSELPHEYLTSDLKEDIKILFEVKSHKPVVTLWYTYEGRVFQCSERIISADMPYHHIRCAEEKLTQLIKETL